MAVIGETLLLLLVLAILLEQGLAVLFNWRWFRRYLDGRGVKLPIAFFSALFFVTGFNINAIYDIVGAFSTGDVPSTTWPGFLLTALIVAGGSSLVFQLFEVFGLRTPIRNRKEVDRLRQLARLRVSVTRSKAAEGRSVLVSVATKTVDGSVGEATVVGSLTEDADTAPATPLPGFALTPGHHVIELSYMAAATGELVGKKREVTAGPGASIALDFEL